MFEIAFKFISVLAAVFHLWFRLFHCHSDRKCQFESNFLPGYCSKLNHSRTCKPVSEFDIAQRQCKMAVAKLTIDQPLMTPHQIKEASLIKEGQSLLKELNKIRPPDKQLETLPDNKEILFGKTMRNVSREIYYQKAGLSNI